VAGKARYFAKRTVNRVQDMAQGAILQMKMRRYDAQKKAKATGKDEPGGEQAQVQPPETPETAPAPVPQREETPEG
jgi:hypothetical protein